VNPALKAAELMYRGVNRVRRSLYRAGVLKPRRLPRPVISVGNIAAGGTGKTPAVIALARYLTGRGHRVAVLTRGYGRSGTGGRVESADPVKFGDEPVVIKISCEKADVIVGEKRYENGLSINCDVYVLDDGFQHLQLARDLDIVIDVPAGPFLREGRSALRDADLVIPRRIRTNADMVRGKRVFAFAGLADNRQFFSMLTDSGAQIAGTLEFPDHHPYSIADIEAIRRAARNSGTQLIVTTEKDAVKVRQPDIIALPIEFVFPPEAFERIESLLTK
jgi:tetraacyldisaccharide 4'-kinase